MKAIEASKPIVLEPDAIFDRDGLQVWPEYGASRTYGTFQFHAEPTTDSGWGYFQEGDGVSFRRRDKR